MQNMAADLKKTLQDEVTTSAPRTLLNHILNDGLLMTATVTKPKRLFGDTISKRSKYDTVN
jgi:hypothetical protein